jgi:hypothetical protein
MVNRVFSEKLFRELCRRARESTERKQEADSLLALMRLVYREAASPEPDEIHSVAPEIFYMNQILTFVELRMDPPFAVRRVILEELFEIKGPSFKEPKARLHSK